MNLLLNHSSLPGWSGLLRFIYPELCQICREERATAEEGFVCAQCCAGAGGVQFIQEPFCKCCGTPFDGAISTSFECSNCRDMRLHFRSARAAVKMTPLVQKVIHWYKYNNALWFEGFLRKLLVGVAAREIAPEKYDLLVPIPLHWRKRWQRAFNQSERLAKILNEATAVPVHAGLIKRVQPTPTQTRLTRAQRAENVKGAFAYRGPERLKGERVALIDDVLTTGATGSSCAKVLMENGAGVVDVWTVARGTLQ